MFYQIKIVQASCCLDSWLDKENYDSEVNGDNRELTSDNEGEW